MTFLYNIFIIVFEIAVKIAAIGNAKAKQWVEGRKNTWQQLKKQVSSNEPLIWIHASSAGEFEQAKPLIEELKKNYPYYKVLVTFFSPSGYNVAKNYSPADYTFYLPVDTTRNARCFIEAINPSIVIFVKYDFWYHYLLTIHNKKIPLLLISSVFRKEQTFFKWYGGFYKNMLGFFTQIFVQDKFSFEILQKNGITHITLSGDTRFDQVHAIASNFIEIPFIKEFIGSNKVLVAGSTWPDDESLLKETLGSFSELKLLIAPHEIHEQHIQAIQKQFPGSVLYSEMKNNVANNHATVLIIDTVGLLSKLYHYATVAYVGGGFTRDGIHNVLEAAVYAKPVLFGPNYKKYKEGKDLIEVKGGFSVTTPGQLKKILEIILHEHESYEDVAQAAHTYIYNNIGATKKIMDYIQENRLLTN